MADTSKTGDKDTKEPAKPVVKPNFAAPAPFRGKNFAGQFNTKGFSNPAAMTKTQHKG